MVYMAWPSSPASCAERQGDAVERTTLQQKLEVRSHCAGVSD